MLVGQYCYILGGEINQNVSKSEMPIMQFF